MSARWTRGQHLLLWVRSGRADVHLPARSIRVEAGVGLWVPASLERSVDTTAGTVAFPLLIEPAGLSGAPDRPRRFTVSPGWSDWLIQQYVHMISPITHVGHVPAAALSILGVGPVPASATSPVARAQGRGYPPWPDAEPAAIVARELARDPASPRAAHDWAELVACSQSTLTRSFSATTGMTFSRWRTRWRTAVAVGLLADGHDVADAAALVGFASRRGFTAAFRSVHGCSPIEYRIRMLQEWESESAGPTDSAGHRLGDPPRVPSTYSASRVNDFHVLLWQYRGSGQAVIGDRRVRRSQGDAIWLPAGIENRTLSPQGSINVPVHDAPRTALEIQQGDRVVFPASWESYLLYASVTSYMMLRPSGHDPRQASAVLHGLLAAQGAGAIRLPVSGTARALAQEFLRRPSQTATSLSTVPVVVDEAFRAETGMSYRSWAQDVCMRTARDMLAEGIAPGAVAARLGYRHASNFSRAFARFHGVPPRHHRGQR